MTTNTSGSAGGDTPARLVCQRVVRTLIEKYAWTLLQEDVLAALVLDLAPERVSPAELKRLAINQYTIAWYQACRQEEDASRCEQGYRELSRLLFRVAYSRWPDLAENVVQRALVLVYEQIDRCQSPVTFVAFALSKLRQACKDELRERSGGPSWEALDALEAKEDWATPQARLSQREILQMLVDAIRQLPDRRQQKAVLLKFFGGLSDDAIGARLGVTAGNVRVLRHRGVARLQQDTRLKRYFEEEGPGEGT